MQYKLKPFLFIAIFVSIFLAIGVSSIQAGDKDMKGWEIDSPYNQLYDVREFEKSGLGWYE